MCVCVREFFFHSLAFPLGSSKWCASFVYTFDFALIFFAFIFVAFILILHHISYRLALFAVFLCFYWSVDCVLWPPLHMCASFERLKLSLSQSELIQKYEENKNEKQEFFFKWFFILYRIQTKTGDACEMLECGI